MPVYHVKVYACLNFVIKGKNYDLPCICIAFEKGVCKHVSDFVYSTSIRVSYLIKFETGVHIRYRSMTFT